MRRRLDECGLPSPKLSSMSMSSWAELGAPELDGVSCEVVVVVVVAVVVAAVVEVEVEVEVVSAVGSGAAATAAAAAKTSGGVELAVGGKDWWWWWWWGRWWAMSLNFSVMEPLLVASAWLAAMQSDGGDWGVGWSDGADGGLTGFGGWAG